MRATLESIEQAIEMGLGKITYGELKHVRTPKQITRRQDP